MVKPNPHYHYIVCDECGSRDLADVSNDHRCIICDWRLTGKAPNGLQVDLQGIREAWTKADESALAFLKSVLQDLLDAGYSPRQIEQAYQKL